MTADEVKEEMVQLAALLAFFEGKEQEQEWIESLAIDVADIPILRENGISSFK
jgi:hypothetical protein